MASTTYTFTDEDQGLRVDFDVTATVIPFERATYDSPGEGGYLEDVEFSVDKVFITIDDEDLDITASVTPAFRKILINKVELARGNGYEINDYLYDHLI